MLPVGIGQHDASSGGRQGHREVRRKGGFAAAAFCIADQNGNHRHGPEVSALSFFIADMDKCRYAPHLIFPGISGSLSAKL